MVFKVEEIPDKRRFNYLVSPYKPLQRYLMEIFGKNISLSLHTIRDEDHDSLLQWTDDIFSALSRILSQDVKR